MCAIYNLRMAYHKHVRCTYHSNVHVITLNKPVIVLFFYVRSYFRCAQSILMVQMSFERAQSVDVLKYVEILQSNQVSFFQGKKHLVP